MRKIEEKIVDTIKANINDWESVKTITLSIRDVIELQNGIINFRLWGHKIFTLNLKTNKARFSFCGYMTSTTKSRINVLLGLFCNSYVNQKNWGLYFDGKTNIKAGSAYEVNYNGSIQEVKHMFFD